MALKTPPLHAKGIFSLAAPWSISSAVIYECIAIRDFADFVDKGEDVFELFYEPKALARSVYDADKLVGANIITLVSANHPAIHVPDTYITAFPLQDSVPYKSVLLSVALGALPDSLDLTFLISQIQGVVSDVTGVTSQVGIHVLPNSDAVSQSQHTTLEAAREAAVENRTTDRARLIASQALVASQGLQIEALSQVLIDNDYAGPAP